MTRVLMWIVLACAVLTGVSASAQVSVLRRALTPQLYMTSMERYSTGSGKFIRFNYDVINKSAFGAELFTPAPNLPPCGTNANSSRTWVDFFDSTGKRLYGFCALGKPADLGKLWFALPEGQVPPYRVYIVIHDRQTGAKYKSNLEVTVLTPAPIVPRLRPID